MKIEYDLSPESQQIIESAFSDQVKHAEIANKLSKMITEDFMQLLGGKRRYLSISHQYIEWIQQLYALVLPNEEFSNERLINSFYFPPGQATYISRVLKGRQNLAIQINAKKNLIQKLHNEIIEYEGLSAENQIINRNRLLLLTDREYMILDTLVAKLILNRTLKEKQQVTDRLGKEGYKVNYLIENIRIVHTNLNP